MNKKQTAICILIAAIILAVVCIGILAARQSADTPDRLLSLGEKYLTELNYEQALVQFLKVIEIDPMNPRGYTGAAEAYIGLGRTEEAIEVLRQGLDRTDDDTIRGMLARLELESAEINGAEQESGATEGAADSNPNSQDIVTDAKYAMPEIPYKLDRLNVPYINLVSDDARQVNEQLHSYFEDVALFGDPNPGEFDSEHGPWYTDIDYAYYVNGDILSVVVVRESGGTAPPIYEVKTYNLSISNGTMLHYGDLADYCGYELEDTLNSFINSAQSILSSIYGDDPIMEMYLQLDVDTTANMNRAWFSSKQMPWFLNENGELCGFVYVRGSMLPITGLISCYTVNNANYGIAAGKINPEKEFFSACEPIISTPESDSLMGTWEYISTPGNSKGVMRFSATNTVMIDSDGNIQSLMYSYEPDVALLTINFPDEETLFYVETIDDATLKVFTDFREDWMNSGSAFPYEYYHFTPSGMAFDGDDFILLTRTEDIELPTVAGSNPLLDKLCDGYWINDGFRLSDTEVYRFERGVKDPNADMISGIYYWDYYNEGNGSWRESEKYILSGDVLTIYMGNDIADTLDYDSNSGQFISRVRKQMVEQERMEDGVYIPAKTQPYSLLNRADDPR